MGIAREVIRVRDDDTGEEIIYFVRRGRPYLYLRHAKPIPVLVRGRVRMLRPFIKRLLRVEIRVYKEVKYSIKEAKKQNPLYLDAGAFTQVSPEDFPKKSAIKDELIKVIDNVVTMKFGRAVTRQLLKERGVVYGSKPEYDALYEKGEVVVSLVWKHKPEEKAKSEKLRERL